MIIREYQNKDERKYLECRVLAYLDSSYYNDVITKKSTYEGECITYLCENNNHIVGFIEMELNSQDVTITESKPCAIIWNLGVIPEYRTQGIAKKLWMKALKYASNKGIKHFELWTQEDVPANKFYESIGFTLSKENTWLRCYTRDSDRFTNNKAFKDLYGIESIVFEAPYKKKEELKPLCYRIDEVRLYYYDYRGE